MPDRLAKLLATVGGAASGEPPPGLIERTRQEAARVRRARQRRTAAIAAVAIAATVGGSFTPPGRAATGWLADVAGFGEEPTLEQVGSVEGSAVVIASGTLPDGTAYEVVAKRVNRESLPQIGPDPEELSARARRTIEERQENDPLSGRGLICFQVDFPGTGAGGQGGHCTDGSENGTGIGNESGAFHQLYATNGEAVIDRDGPGVFVAVVEPTETDDVRVYELRPDGSRTEIASQLIEVEGEVLSRVGIETPKSVTVAELDGATVAAGNRGELEVRAVAYGSDGVEIGHEDVNFMPASCPDRPSKPPPPPPAGRTLDNAHPAAPADVGSFDEPFTDICPPMLRTGGPVRFTAFALADEPVPPALLDAAEAQGWQLGSASATDYDLAHTIGVDLVSVDHAAQKVSEQVTGLFGAATMGGMGRIYLARAVSSDRLVYVIEHSVRATQEGRDWERLPEPRSFFGIVDAESGELLHFSEL